MAHHSKDAEKNHNNTCKNKQVSKKEVEHCTVQKISARELPLSCPTPKMTLWDHHPRVYLPIEQTGYAICPYCGTEYILKNI